MRALVTGGAGFIGSNLVDRLLSLGHEVVVIDNESSYDTFYWNTLSDNYKLDIRDYKATRHLYADVDVVFHLAAESKIQLTLNNPIEAVSVNTLGTATVLQCAKEAGVKKVVYSSTSAAYGNNPLPNLETQQDDCLNPYSISKVAGEKLCHMYTDLYGLETIVLRYFNVYGNRHSLTGRYAPVIGVFMSQEREGVRLTITGDGEQRRDFVNVLDVVDANIKAAASKYRGIFNIGSGTNYSVKEIAYAISSLIENIPQRLGESKATLADIEKAKTLLDWHPTYDVLTWIKDNR